MAIELDEVRGLILTALPGAEVEVTDDTGGGDHLSAVVRAAQFAGLSRIEQHKLVKRAVQERMDDGSIHALSVRTVVVEDDEPVTSEMDAEPPTT